MSATTSSEMILSKILSQTGKFEIGRIWSTFSVGVTFGMGVISSDLYLAGHEPVLMLVLNISARGMQNKLENFLSIFAGMSPQIVDLLVFMLSIKGFTSPGV